MPAQCPLCRQPLPEGINESELQARIRRLASPTFAVEKKRLKEEFETQLVAEREMARQRAERQFERELRAAKEQAQEEVAKTVRLAAYENEAKLEKLQAEREREKVRHEAESAKLQGKLDDLSRKLEKQSGEQLGAEAELDLFTELRHAFPADRFERVGRGVKGADIVHQVMDGTKVAGRIVYESKNTSNWQNGFIAQAKKYQTQYETPHVMVVTRVFPLKLKGLCVLNGIPVVEKRVVVALATVIREGIIDIARLRLSGKFRDEKSQELFEYIVGAKFCTRFREIAEGVASLREQQQKERTWHENAWQVEAKIHEQIENRYREVDAQIRAIVREGSNGKSKFAAESEGLQEAETAIHETESTVVSPTATP
jgi:hypothetical protein